MNKAEIIRRIDMTIEGLTLIKTSLSSAEEVMPTPVASVEDSENQELSKRKSESHYNHIDFQYVVKGTERFGIIEHLSSKENCEYKPDVMHYDYDKSLTRFYDSSPNKFFLFFPDDWHIAKVKTDKADQAIRVIVFKLDYVEL